MGEGPYHCFGAIESSGCKNYFKTGAFNKFIVFIARFIARSSNCVKTFVMDFDKPIAKSLSQGGCYISNGHAAGPCNRLRCGYSILDGGDAN